MASKKKSKKSVIPLKLQIPFAILLGIVFVLLLNSRLKGLRNDKGTPAPGSTNTVETAEVLPGDSEQRVEILIDKVSDEKPKREHSPLPALASDPFAKPERPYRKAAGNEPEEVKRAMEREVYDGQSREQFVASLTLQATLIDGDRRFVLINDTLFAEKDNIGAFKIVEIGERAAFIDDGRGSMLLEMEGDDLL